MNVQEKWEQLRRELPDGPPIGTVFQTENNFYYYDTPTGKILKCNPLEYQMMKLLLEDTSLDQIFTDYPESAVVKALDNIIAAVGSLDILRLSAFQTMYIPENYKELVSDHLNNMTLELTERCNLRCGYCIYNDGCEKTRNFGMEDMSLETAYKAIEYAKYHSSKQDELHIGFYGGEPLLCYSLIKDCVHYAKQIMPDKTIYFAITTNAVLLTKELALELSRIENISITVSLDGPKEYHDAYRVDSQGNGSFEATLLGLKLLCDSFGYERAKDHILLSMVYAPPNSMDKLEEIQEFFECLPWLPRECMKQITYPDPDSYQCIAEYVKKNKKEFLLSRLEEKDDSLAVYSNKYWADHVFTSRGIQNKYLRINRRTIWGQANDTIAMNGCCIPAQRKIYVTVKGQLKLCEKAGNIPVVGNLSSGLDSDLTKETYLEKYRENSFPHCKTCWYARLCNVCYARCYSGDCFDIHKKAIACNESKKSGKQALISYFNRLEQNPAVFDFLAEEILQ